MSADTHKKTRAPETLCVHGGEEHHGTNDSLTTDISQGSVFVVPNTNELRKYAEGDSKAYLYSRYANPTVAVAERKIAALEGAESAVVTSSGMAAIMSLVLSTCRTGDEIVSMLDLYGGTTHLLQDTLSKYGVTTRFVPYNELCRIEDYFTKKTRLLFLETPTNPTLRCVDIAALAKLGHQKHTCVVVDNTFASPMLQRPLELGADIVLHSATKFLCGHSDVMAGAVVVRNEELGQDLYLIQNGEGAALAPFDSYLLLRGMKTLALRLDRQQANARKIAEWLNQQPAVDRVYFPGLANEKQRRVHRLQASGDGAVLSFVTGDPELSRAVVEATRLFAIAVSFGGVNSTISLPNYMSHASIPAHLRQQKSIPADLVRVSVGAEDADDLIDDLGQAFEVASRQSVAVREMVAD